MVASKPTTKKRRAARRAAAKASWSEKEFEQWFEKHPQLWTGTLAGERVLVLRIEREFESVVDIVALDAEGRLVIIEVKNERTGRATVGQALEYLSTYEDVTLQELSYEYDAIHDTPLSLAFRNEFGHELTEISPDRRVFLAAPAFNPHSDVCARYLSSVITKRAVSFDLLKITQEREDPVEFSVERLIPRALVPAQRLQGFVESVGETLYWRLDTSWPPVFWRIGKRKADGTLKLLEKKAPRDLVLVKTRRRIQLQGEKVPTDVDVSQCGTAWTRDGRVALLLGSIGKGSQRRAVLADFKDGVFKCYGVISDREFKRLKRTTGEGLPSWQELARLARKGQRVVLTGHPK